WVTLGNFSSPNRRDAALQRLALGRSNSPGEDAPPGRLYILWGLTLQRRDPIHPGKTPHRGVSTFFGARRCSAEI
ncbi:MAG: hypothetical protein PHQ40_12700, partial [Anaerolineaceae bacterium]|nr:hypothetical protein [Anaerolineaceae bacterium]